LENNFKSYIISLYKGNKSPATPATINLLYNYLELQPKKSNTNNSNKSTIISNTKKPGPFIQDNLLVNIPGYNYITKLGNKHFYLEELLNDNKGFYYSEALKRPRMKDYNPENNAPIFNNFLNTFITLLSLNKLKLYKDKLPELLKN
jgi:hypothetical protein